MKKLEKLFKPLIVTLQAFTMEVPTYFLIK
jgi:hypothetical protein